MHSGRGNHRSTASPPNSAGTQYPSPYHQSYASSNSGAGRSPNAGGKASQMLGVNAFDMPMSATQSSASMHSDPAEQMIHKYNQFGQSSSHSNSSRDKSAKDSSTKMTLKKARSLFGNKSKSPEFSPPPELPSPPARGAKQGDSTNPYTSGGHAALSHSKSYGSLIGNNRGPDYRFPGTSTNADMRSNDHYHSGKPDQQTSPSTSSHPYTASVALRKASMPNIEQPGRRHGFSAADPLLGGGAQEADCPICLESLSIRLPGEKPHIVPVCGHKLHADCFEAAYGDPVDFGAADPLENIMGSAGRMRKKTRPQGNCAVCRSEMRLGDPAESGKNSKALLTKASFRIILTVSLEFAAISGQGGQTSPASPTLDTHKVHSISKRTISPERGSYDRSSPAQATSGALHDPSEDQDLVNPHQYLPAYMQHIALGASRGGGLQHPGMEKIVPKITVRAEHASITRPADPDKKVHLTCMVTVEIPSRIPGLTAATRSGSGMVNSASQQRLAGTQHGQSSSQSTILGAGGPPPLPAGAPPVAPSARSRGSDSQAPSLPPLLSSDYRRESNATASSAAQTEDFPISPSVSAFSAGVNQLSLPPSQPLPLPVQLAGQSISMEKNISNATSGSGGMTGTGSTPGTAASSAFTTPHSVSAASFKSSASLPMQQPRPLGALSLGEAGASASTSTLHLAQQDGTVRSTSPLLQHGNSSSLTLTAAAQEEKDREAHGPFASVFADLQARMADWKGHEPAAFGSLRMHDTLQVKKDKNVREFVVYLFEEALLCVVDDRKKGRPFQHQSNEELQVEKQERLRLKGRVFVKHMKQVEETSSVSQGLSLTISMVGRSGRDTIAGLIRSHLQEDDSLESFVILFATRGTLEVWRSQIQALVDHHRPPIPANAKTASTGSLVQTASASKRDSIFSNDTNRSDGSRVTKATTAPSMTSSSAPKDRSPLPEQAVPPIPDIASLHLRSATSLSDSLVAAWVPPEPHTFVPIDLMLVISIPPVSAGGPSSSSLKLRLIRSTLDFVIHSIGPRARVSIVAYTAGDGAVSQLKKTPWLAVGRPEGLHRLEQAIAELAGEGPGRHSEGLTNVNHKEEKVTVATAVNLALDIVLQRQVKSATAGMILLNDGRDGALKQQIDAVMARAEAAAMPIHSIGWGRAHEPQALWMLSNYTKGTYTFVREFYQLKDAVAGCIGGMLSVAVSALKLHLNVQERKWFKIRKISGVGGAIVSADGKDVDISLGVIRYGEKKEMLVEVEMASPRAVQAGSSPGKKAAGFGHRQSMTATDDFFLQKVGMDPHSLGDLQQDFYEEIEDGMADDVPIFEVNASFRNPFHAITGEPASRLPYPALLTTTVLPPKSAGAGSDSPTTPSGQTSDPTIVRRRMELLTSDMITRTLLLMSRRQDAQAARLLAETTRIFGAIRANLVPLGVMDMAAVGREARFAMEVLSACMEDIDILRAGCADRAEFDSATRNYGAQQAVALRDQRAWTDRTATEGLFFCREWTALFGAKLQQGSY